MGEYVKVAKKSEVPSDTGMLVEVQGKEIALFNLDGDIRAIYAVCPHQGGPLNEGGVNEGKAMCPWHGCAFDIKTGVGGFNDSIKQPVFNVKVEGEDVFVEV